MSISRMSCRALFAIRITALGLLCVAGACGSPSSGGTGGEGGSGGSPSTGGSGTGGSATAAGGQGGSARTGGQSGSGTGGGVASGGVSGASGGTTASGGRGGGSGGAAGGRGGSAGSAGGRGGSAGAAGGRGGSAGSAAGHSGATGGAAGSGSCSVAAGSVIGTFTDPVTATDISPPNPPGIAFKDTDGKPVNAHGGGIIKVCDTFYLHGEYFLSTTTDNNFNGFSMYSSKDLATWKNEGIILPQQPSGQLGPNRKGERPHIVRCPSTGEFVLYAHAADVTYQADKEVVYATSPTVNGQYTLRGSLTDASGNIAAHSDMSALSDGDSAYVVTESGWVYTLAADCHSWVSAKQYSTVNGTTGGVEAPTVFKAGSTWYWIGSDKTGWRANADFYSTAPAINGPWTYQGYLAPQGKLTWMTQSTWVMPVAGTQSTTYVYWGDHWYGNQDTTAPGKHNDQTTYVF
ncbi:MAG TPA: family 43 glycosylhydrolase, partial [Polyangia bacterium]|nr:family 43 glycosylhydrolase [Polyangia bacterium]